MTPTFGTSDTHLGHANIRDYCPWRQEWSNDVNHHDEMLISAWNETAEAHRVILHCGDMCFGDVERTRRYIARLNGHIMLICGNHDRSPKRMMELGVWRAEKRFEFELEGRRILAIHDPADVAIDDVARVDVVLHGHLHGGAGHRDTKLPEQHLHKFIDIGVDARRSIRPVRLADLLMKHFP